MSHVLNIELSRRAKALKFRIVTILAVLILVIWAAVGVSIYSSRETALVNLQSNSANLALAFDDEVTHVLNNTVRTMDVVADRMRAKGSDMNIYAWARELQIITGPVIEGGIIAPNGMLIASTREPNLKPVDMSDREHFRVQRDGKFKGVYIGKPVHSRYNGQVLIPITERVETGDGRFVGVLIFELLPAKLTTLSKSIDLSKAGIIGLIGFDDIIRARFSKNSPEGLDGVDRSIARIHGQGFDPQASQGSYVVRGTVDNLTRLYSYRRIANYPLFVTVGLGYDEGLASWWTNAKTILALAAVATLLLGGLTLYLVREIDRRTMCEIELADERTKLETANIGLQAANAELKESKARAEQAETTLVDAIECASEAFVIYDKDDRFVLCNDAFRRLFPQSVRYLVPGATFEAGLRCCVACGELKDAIGREEEWLAARLQRHRQAKGAKEAIESKEDIEQTLTDGRHIMIIERRMTSGGIAGLRIDVTNLVRTREALEKALDKAEAVNRAKTLFLANMSHELRTPLNAVIGFSEIIKDQTLGLAGVPAYAEYAKDIHNAGDHLLEIITNVLDASRIEVGKFELKEETVEIGELVQSAMQTVRVQAGMKSIALEQRLPGEPAGLRADALRLRQILINLLANAVKFTSEGGRVTLSFEASPAAAVFAVADTGIGMSPDEIAVATEPFRQVENTLVKRHEGVGLGLSLAKNMTEMHGGSLEIESEKGAGTTVRVVLPAGRIRRAPKASAAA